MNRLVEFRLIDGDILVVLVVLLYTRINTARDKKRSETHDDPLVTIFELGPSGFLLDDQRTRLGFERRWCLFHGFWHNATCPQFWVLVCHLRLVDLLQSRSDAIASVQRGEECRLTARWRG
jgi:hypothetical protein